MGDVSTVSNVGRVSVAQRTWRDTSVSTVERNPSPALCVTRGSLEKITWRHTSESTQEKGLSIAHNVIWVSVGQLTWRDTSVFTLKAIHYQQALKSVSELLIRSPEEWPSQCFSCRLANFSIRLYFLSLRCTMYQEQCSVEHQLHCKPEPYLLCLLVCCYLLIYCILSLSLSPVRFFLFHFVSFILLPP